MVQQLAKALIDRMRGLRGPILTIQQGANRYSFVLEGDIPSHQKRTTLAIVTQTGTNPNSDILDSPWHFSAPKGQGWAKADVNLVRQFGRPASDVDLFTWDSSSIMIRNGMFCLGPLSQVPTDPGSGSILRVARFYNLGGYFYYVGNAVETATLEQCYFWTGSTTTWALPGTGPGLTKAWELLNVGFSGFPVGAMVYSSIGHTVGKVNAFRTLPQLMGANYAQDMFQTTPAGAWSIGAGGAIGITLSGSTTAVAVGVIVIGSSAYGLVTNASGIGGVLRVATNLTAAGSWANAGGTPALASTFQPTAFLSWVDGSKNIVPTAITREGISQYSINATSPVWNTVLDMTSDIESNNGVSAFVFQPQISGAVSGSSFLIVPNGKRLWACSWGANGLITNDIMASMPHGLPTYRQGRILACSGSKDYIQFAVGGEDSSHIGGVYEARFDGTQWTVLSQIYDSVDNQEQVRALAVSSNDDATMRLHMAEDTVGGGNYTTQTYFASPDGDPRFISGFLHTAQTTAYLVLAVNDRDLPSFGGTWRAMRVIGSNLGTASGTGKMGSVFFSPDQKPLDGSFAIDGAAGNWSTTMGAITASLSNITWPVSGPTQAVTTPATPAGTGYAANQMQIMAKLQSNGANASCYITSIDFFVQKHPAITYVWEFTINTRKSAGGRSRPQAAVIADLKSILSTNLDCLVNWGDQHGSGIILAPYSYAGYGFEPSFVSNSGVFQEGTTGNGIEEMAEGTVKIAFATIAVS